MLTQWLSLKRVSSRTGISISILDSNWDDIFRVDVPIFEVGTVLIYVADSKLEYLSQADPLQHPHTLFYLLRNYYVNHLRNKNYDKMWSMPTLDVERWYGRVIPLGDENVRM